MKLKLTQRGYETMTGLFGSNMFENGVSVEDIIPRDARNIAISIACEYEDGSNPNPAQALIDNMAREHALEQQNQADQIKLEEMEANADREAELARQLPDGVTVGLALKSDATEITKVALDQTVVEVKEPVVEEVKKPAIEETDNSGVQPAYTADKLAAIADKEGIKGLRALAEPLGIKGTAIADLMRELLKVNEKQVKDLAGK